MTPEQVHLAFEIAGIGSRAMAQMIDLVFIGIIYGILWGSILLVSASGVFSSILNYFIGVGILASFVFFWAYFIVSEYFWSGQTIGKKIVRIRVLRSNGMAVTLFASLVRNLLRLLDFMPAFYGVGLVSMIVDKSERRVGDLAAGTMVVKDVFGYQLSLLHPEDRHSALSKGTTSIRVDPGAASINEIPETFLVIEAPGVKVTVDGELPVDVENSICLFAVRKKQMTQKAAEQVAEVLWETFFQLPVFTVEFTSDEQTAKEKSIVKKSFAEILVKLGAELTKSNKG